MVEKSGLSLSLALTLLAAAHALQGGNPRAGGSTTPYNRYEQSYNPRYHQGPGQVQHQQPQHQHHQEEQRNPEPQSQNRHQHQQQQHGTTAIVSPSSEAAEGVVAPQIERPPLPYGWGELRAGDGRPYYVYYPNGTVQWERPAPPKDPDSEQQQTRGSAERGQPPLPAEVTTADKAYDVTEFATGISGEREITDRGGGAIQNRVEEDVKILVGESEMSDAEGPEGNMGDGNELRNIAESVRAKATSLNQHTPTEAERREGQAAGEQEYPPSADVEPIIFGGASLPDSATIADSFQRQQNHGVRVEGDGDGDKDGRSRDSSPPDSWSAQIQISPATSAHNKHWQTSPSPMSPQRIQPPDASEEPPQPWNGATSSTLAERLAHSGESKPPPMPITGESRQPNPALPPSTRGSRSGQEQQSLPLPQQPVHNPWGGSSSFGDTTVANARDESRRGPPQDLNERRGETRVPGQEWGSNGISNPWTGDSRRGLGYVERPVGESGSDGSDRDGAGPGSVRSPGGRFWTQSHNGAPPVSHQRPMGESGNDGSGRDGAGPGSVRSPGGGSWTQSQYRTPPVSHQRPIGESGSDGAGRYGAGPGAVGSPREGSWTQSQYVAPSASHQRPMEESGSDGAGRDGAGPGAVGSPGGEFRAQSQYGAPPVNYQQPQPGRTNAGGAYEEPFSHQDSRFQTNRADTWGSGGSEPRSGPNSLGWEHQHPTPDQGSSEWKTGHQLLGSAPVAGNRPGAGDGPTWWSSSAQSGMPEGEGYGRYGGAQETWEEQRGRWGMEGHDHRQTLEGNSGYDGGYYDYRERGGSGRVASASRRNEDEYSGYPSGSRALVPRNAHSYSSGMLEVREQGLQLVKGAWARVLVGTGRTRAVLRDYGDWAGTAASNAGVKIKSTVGSVTNRVADVLEGDPQGVTGPYGQPPRRDGYYGGSISSPTPDRTGQNYPRSWGPVTPPSGYGFAPQTGANPQAAPPPGSYNGGDRYSDSRQKNPHPGDAERGARGRYAGGTAVHPHSQQGSPSPKSTFEGGREPRVVRDRQGGPVAAGPGVGAGSGMPSYGGQQRQPSQQQQRRGEGQERTGQWQRDGVSDGGYWAPL